MPTATLTTYECEHDLLPAVCVKCGAPATARVPRPVPVPPRRRSMFWFIPVFLVVYLAVPAVVVLLFRLVRRISIGIPVCEADQGHWAWRDRARRRLWPAIAVASLAVQAVCLTGLILHPLLYAHAAAGVIVLGFVIDWLAIGRGEVGVGRAGSDRVGLTGIHPAFVAALIEDRARDRVDNPARRTLRGDIRDDFDDELE